MLLDVPTLFAASTGIIAFLGMFLFFAWIQDRSIRALAWWAAAYLVGGMGVALWTFDKTVSPPLPFGLGGALLFIACGMIWNGARLFHGGRGEPLVLYAGGVIWFIACQYPVFAQPGVPRVMLSSIMVSAYAFFTARELWFERRNRHRARWAAIFVPLLHGLVFLPPIALALMQPAGLGVAPLPVGWKAVFILEALLYAIGTAFIVLLMTKERVEHIHKTAAATDTLTGLLNRRGFLERAQALIARHSSGDRRITALMFDLDHFKSINDRFGHATGDEALRVFAKTIQGAMREGDIIGRLGGEEFAVVLPGGITAAEKVGERVRSAFEIAGVEIGGHRMGATVSIGAACASMAGCNIDQLLSRADTALYAAKEGGRNRLAFAPDEAAATPVSVSVPAPMPRHTKAEAVYGLPRAA